MASNADSAVQPGRRGNKRRLFFALWPDEHTRATVTHATRSAAAASGGRPVPAQNLHVTLAFLGGVEDSRLTELCALSTGVAAAFTATASELELRFDVLECWRQPRLLVAGVSDPSLPGALGVKKLGRDLEAVSRRIGLGSDAGGVPERKFRPHVTLARDVRHFPAARPLDPIAWRFAEFVLVDSKTGAQGSVYTVLRTFPIAAVNRGPDLQ